jgi:PAS domain-containing protein
VGHPFAAGDDERMFADIAAAVQVGLYVYQADDPLDAGSLRLVYANPASVTVTGAELADIVGQPIREAFPLAMQTEQPDIYLEIALGGPARHLGDVEYGDDRVETQMFSVHAFPLPNRSVGLSFTNRTAQRLAEDHAVQTLESMSDAFFTVDADWRFTYLNPQSEPILKRRREDLVGKNMWEEFPEGVGSRFYDEYHRAVRDQITVRSRSATSRSAACCRCVRTRSPAAVSPCTTVTSRANAWPRRSFARLSGLTRWAA